MKWRTFRGKRRSAQTSLTSLGVLGAEKLMKAAGGSGEDSGLNVSFITSKNKQNKVQ